MDTTIFAKGTVVEMDTLTLTRLNEVGWGIWAPFGFRWEVAWITVVKVTANTDLISRNELSYLRAIENDDSTVS